MGGWGDPGPPWPRLERSPGLGRGWRCLHAARGGFRGVHSGGKELDLSVTLRIPGFTAPSGSDQAFSGTGKWLCPISVSQSVSQFSSVQSVSSVQFSYVVEPGDPTIPITNYQIPTLSATAESREASESPGGPLGNVSIHPGRSMSSAAKLGEPRCRSSGIFSTAARVVIPPHPGRRSISEMGRKRGA